MRQLLGQKIAFDCLFVMSNQIQAKKVLLLSLYEVKQKARRGSFLRNQKALLGTSLN